MQFEFIMEVNVRILPGTIQCLSSAADSVVMIPFDGSASGPYFSGTILPGGVDTQVIGPGGRPHTLSARYIIQGADYTGAPCCIYIENNGVIHGEGESQYFMTQPKFITNSQALDFLNTDLFASEVLPGEAGPKIIIYRIAR